MQTKENSTKGKTAMLSILANTIILMGETKKHFSGTPFFLRRA